jgi:excisionase family DNA binding protein
MGVLEDLEKEFERIRGLSQEELVDEVVLDSFPGLRVAILRQKLAAMAAELEKLSTAKKDEELLTSKDLAPLVGVTHPKTVERWVREKGLPCVRIGRSLRFRRGDVLRWLAQQES